MNNEKLILRALMELLLDPNPKERLLLATEITKALNPKEVVPYEKSLEEKTQTKKEAEEIVSKAIVQAMGDAQEEICECGHGKEWHTYGEEIRNCDYDIKELRCKCKNFVKSSTEEKKDE